MRVGIIGIGAIAPVHIRGLLGCGQQIAALCDTEAEKCEKANADFGLSAAVYTDYTAMLEKEKPDVIHICTPHYLHAEMICAGLSRGIHVLCEKPLAISLDQLGQIEDAVKHSSARLGVCFQNRFGAAVYHVRSFLRDKKILSASANLLWERDAAYYAQGAWRGTKAMEGGGVMINQAIHGLDLLQWICGMPESVIAHVSNNSLKNEIEVEDTAFGLFRLANGGNFIVNATNTAKFSFPVYYTFRTDSDTVEFSGDNIIINGKFLTKNDGTPLIGKEVWGTGHQALFRCFYKCLADGEPFPIDFAEAQKAIRLILAMYRSEGREIPIF